MPDTPILSYKRNTPNTSSRPASPALTGSFSPQVSASPSLSGNRKVSARRKALQEFYNIQREEEEIKELTKGDKQEVKPENVSANEKVDLTSLNDPKQLEHFIRTSNIEEILKVRNSITNTFNSNDSAKKSIIYDNYYELIKLGQTLGQLSRPKPPAKTGNGSGFGIYHEKDDPQDHIESVLEDLSSFLNDESTNRFGGDFASVVQDLKSEGDDNASTVGIAETAPKTKEIKGVAPSELVHEISDLLSASSFSDGEKSKMVQEIDALLEKLDGKHELLVLQLNKLKQSLL